MFDWLLSIGEKNRKRIRHLDLHFLGFYHTSPFTGRKYCQRRQFRTGSTIKATLYLLAEGHRIKTLKVSGNILGAPLIDPSCDYTYYNYAFAHFFLRPQSSFRQVFHARGCGWQNALKRIVGVRRLIWAPVETGFPDMDPELFVMEKCKRGYEEVRQVMESGQNESNWSIATDEDYSDTYIDQTSRFN